MPCPHCQSPRTQEQIKKTSLGYRTFRCAACARRFNERSGTPFNDLRVPTDIVFLVVLWRLRYPLSLRHLAEMFLERGFAFSHETVRAWEALAAPLLAEGSGVLPPCTERHAPISDWDREQPARSME